MRDLRRSFGKVDAVQGVTFDIYPGQVVGFIGANGAGKTTTMRMMATLETPTSGSIHISGHDVVTDPSFVRDKIGWMPDAYGAYPNMTVGEYLDFYARAFGFKGAERLRRVSEVMDFTDLASISDRMMNKLSKGMGQRLCLGRTLLHDPEVMILDEPAAGLDPKARVEFKQLIRLLAAEGKTIFISSHILSELAEMCDTMLFIDAGRIVHHGSAESLQHGESDQTIVDVQVLGDPEAVVKWASLNAGVHLVETRRQGARLRFDHGDEQELAAHLRRMITDGLAVVDFHRESRKLEDAFVEILTKIQS
ncbi:MAG TPA: ABC transporter ATP-binding protein [Chthoniobacterales bacterium]|nr:ABC transporter ATP-binding protein [Chthoniobacterales bacterium]